MSHSKEDFYGIIRRPSRCLIIIQIYENELSK